MNEKMRDSPFQDPTDFICRDCNSTQGRWIVDESCNGKAIVCRDCGKEEKRRHPWRDEVALLRGLQGSANK